LLYPIGTGILYTIETVTVFFALNTITLSYYTILRSGFIIFNIPWFKYLLKKPVTRLYIASCISLIIAQILSTVQYIATAEASSVVIRDATIVLVSCFLNATYNNLIEYAMLRHGNHIQSIDFQIIFQCTYLIIASPFAIFYTVKHTPPINPSTVTMYFFIAFGLQLYMFNKIYILNSRESIIPANILLSGLDIIRRVIQLTLTASATANATESALGGAFSWRAVSSVAGVRRPLHLEQLLDKSHGHEGGVGEELRRRQRSLPTVPPRHVLVCPPNQFTAPSLQLRR
jgi:hypothetical protein